MRTFIPSQVDKAFFGREPIFPCRERENELSPNIVLKKISHTKPGMTSHHVHRVFSTAYQFKTKLSNKNPNQLCCMTLLCPLTLSQSDSYSVP